MSYSIDTHIIEDPAQCGEVTGDVCCVDSLTLDFPGMGASHTTCGTQPPSPTITDGSSELNMEFMSNRARQQKGFLLLAWCVDPGIKKSSESLTRSNREVEQQVSVTCTTPAQVWKRNNEWENKTNDTALLKLVRYIQ